MEKLIIGCRQWETEGPPENLIVSHQWWTSAYHPVTPMAGHHLQPMSDQRLCRRWASAGPTESCYLGLVYARIVCFYLFFLYMYTVDKK